MDIIDAEIKKMFEAEANGDELNMVQKAIKITDEAFEGETDKAGNDYTEHLRNVFNRVVDKGGDQVQQTVALLHDLLEDIPSWTEDDLKQYFPNRVIKAVKAMTKRDGESYMQYINRVSGNKDATMVKLADLEDNMRKTKNDEAGEDNDKRLARLEKYQKAYERLSD